MSPSRPGHFIWHDWRPLQQTQASFYEGLLGWTTMPVDGEGTLSSYALFQAAGEAVGGIVPLRPEEKLPSHWISYVAVSDLDRITRRIQAAGGHMLLPPTSIPGRGLFAVVRDSQGALIAPLKAENQDPFKKDILSIPPGHFCWAELWSEDPAEAVRFYQAVFDWEMTPLQLDRQQELWLVNPARQRVSTVTPSSGIAAITVPRAKNITGWIAFFVVEDIADRLVWTEQHRGGVLLDMSLVPTVGYFAVVRDPEGTPIGLFEPLEVA